MGYMVVKGHDAYREIINTMVLLLGGMVDTKPRMFGCEVCSTIDNDGMLFPRDLPHEEPHVTFWHMAWST